MQLYTLNKREIRSFRLRHKTLILTKFFTQTNTFGFFIMTDTIQPIDHIQLRKSIKTHNLQIFNVSKKISTFLTKNSEWQIIKNLLTGNVILLKANNNITLTTTTITFIITNTQFNLRFLFWNKNFYRENTIKTFIQKQHINHILFLIQLIKKISLTPLLFINPFLIRQN